MPSPPYLFVDRAFLTDSAGRLLPADLGQATHSLLRPRSARNGPGCCLCAWSPDARHQRKSSGKCRTTMLGTSNSSSSQYAIRPLGPNARGIPKPPAGSVPM